MFCIKNNIIPLFFKKRYIVNKIKKNEYQVFEFTCVRNSFYIRKNDTNIFTNYGLKLSYCNYSEKDIENNSHVNYIIRKTKINKNLKNIKNKNKGKVNLNNNCINNNYAVKDLINNKKKNINNNFTNNKENNIISSSSINCTTDINVESIMDLSTNNSAEIKLSERIWKNNDEEISKNENFGIEENKILLKCKEKKKKYLFEEFSVFSFNILANSLVDYKYDNNCSKVMNWMNRKEWIFQNIINKLSDIICLQEVENSYFIELQSKLRNLNYKGLFLKKKKESSKDGICIFYNTKVFELLFFDEIIYDKSPLLKKWHVGLIVALKNIKSKKIEYYDETNNKSKIKDGKNNSNDNISNINDIVIVSNTHLIFDSYKGDIKLYQLCYMTYRLILMMNKCINYLEIKDKEQNRNTNILKPCIIFCGDFNITPNSLLYYFIINRYLNLKNINLKFLSGQYLMFKKQYYFNNYLKGIQIRTMFDKSIVEDLKYEQCSNSLENMKKESLFFFFKDKNILNEEYLIKIFAKKNNYLNDFNFFEYYDTLKNKDKNVHDNKEKNLYFRKEDNKHYYKDNQIFLNKNEEKDNNKNEKDDEENYFVQTKEKSNHEKKKNRNIDKEKEIIRNEKEDDFILYYPLYLKSIYNKCIENRVEKSCYKYDSIDKLNNKENNLILNDIPFTVFHGKQKGCVDYIFYSYKTLKNISCTNLPPFDKLAKYGCLPNEKYCSSDHLYLHATLIRRNTD
ncbi:DNase I-like protein, putative [Plasmodium gallinaceum]|uniref:DNase I-like protein, putative n=1 Tax=Plasmodium gallinaceum TaxID=5849 RepID=A0A1J1GRR7_PLAGA|nr:DNase I-like protein, putative [Plasmodium gallinaceum]CRG93992.1 DNase I-like protein, putative [Plasmodium gallinaceum]